MGIGIRLAMLVTSDAREDCEICRVNVAIRARSPFAGVRSGIDREPSVVEDSSSPGRGGVTCKAGGREIRGDVVGITNAGVLRFMARIAVGGSTGVNAVDVALGARDAHVGTGERERRFAVVEAGRYPCRGVMTNFAGSW